VKPTYIQMLVEGHRYEVMLEISGQWAGMVHLIDGEKPHDPLNSDVLITGARYDSEERRVVLGDADVAVGFDAQRFVPLMTEMISRTDGQACELRRFQTREEGCWTEDDASARS
jgi:hypothetical protein